jgi:predicted ATP-grasp superfamily ATP-dependent carboligase
MELGIVGINSRAIASSARKLGFSVFLVDYFLDADIVADEHHALQTDPLRPDLGGEYSKEALVDLAIEKLGGRIENIIPTSEVGCSPKLIKRLEKDFRILGNGSAQVRGAKDWRMLKKILEEVEVEYPKTTVASSLKGVRKAAEKRGFPVVVKGNGVRAALLDEASLTGFACEIPENGFLVQEYVEGIAVSCSVVCGGESASAVSVNRQLIGLQEFGAQGFSYCGNIVPLGSGWDERIAEKATELTAALSLCGSVGVDFLLAENKLVFMEVNTRLQDTFECVERYRGINLVDEHLKALEGEIREYVRELGCFGKGIIYAKEDTVVGDLSAGGGVGDVPLPGSLIKEGEPVCSIYSMGAGPDAVLSSLKEDAARIFFGF